MKRIKCWGIVTLSVIVLFSVLNGCAKHKAPSVKDAEAFVEKNGDDLSIVAEWLNNSEYELYCIELGTYQGIQNGSALCDHGYITVSDQIRPSVERLLDTGRVLKIQKSEYCNAIFIELWISVHEKSCGIAIPIDASKPLEVQYAIQYESLSGGEWQFYFADFNEWRIRHPR